VQRRVEKGLEPQSHARIVFTGPFTYTQEQRIAIRAVASILQVRLREILREELGGTYSVSVSADYTKFPRAEYSLSVDFGCSPDRTDELVKRVFAEVDAFKAAGPTDKQLADAVEAFVREQETNLASNAYLLSQIAAKYENGEVDQMDVLFDLAAWYRKLSADSVRAAARRYLDTGRYVQVALFPEKR
jgi:zinc protease